MNGNGAAERVETVIIGGGQAGLATGYHLRKRGRPFVILDANQRIGDAWRNRWDSLRLFTPARYSGLPSWRLSAPTLSFPTKDEMADYIQAYATRFDLPVSTGVAVDDVHRDGNQFVVTSANGRFEADNVVVPSGSHRSPRVPEFAAELDQGIAQLHSCEYRSPTQLREGPALVVGAGNSGAEIALEVSRTHDGRPVHRRGVVPDQPGLYFVGLQFQYAATSDVLPGVGRDAEYVADQIAARAPLLEASAAPALDAA